MPKTDEAQDSNSSKVICGLTIAQWMMSMDKGLTVEVKDTDLDGWCEDFGLICIDLDDPKFPFQVTTGEYWRECRIKRTEPQFNTGTFPSWLSSEATIVVRFADGKVCATQPNDKLLEEQESKGSNVVAWQWVRV